ncbi:alcohol dehydrogenase [Salinisphaera sp. PC39]|uniref:alcohol dehydrogenase n=1 Tax=Salinisphaera sp. PC39 TaxID=1304156 RepID=UPI0033420355
MTTMRAVQVPEAGGDFELVERPIPTPGPGQVRIKVAACGICHSDAFVKDGAFPMAYPRVPGHEVVGTVDALGDGVTGWRSGQRVGVGWHGGHCWQCDSCRGGDFVTCRNLQICGIAYDGGYAEYMVAPVEALAAVPDALSDAAAAPLLCAGVTTYNALRHSGATAGDVVAVQGVGGLGHLGIQYASRMGFHTVALSRGADKAELAAQLGAHRHIDVEAEDPVKALRQLGGARAILATAPSGKAMSALIGGLGPSGRLIVVGVGADPIEVSPAQIIGPRRSIAGHPSGTPHDSEDTMGFSALAGIEAAIETYPLAEAAAAYDRMIRNEARFRVVLTMD